MPLDLFTFYGLFFLIQKEELVLPQRDRLPFLHRGKGVQDGFIGMPFHTKKVRMTTMQMNV